jgi:hypothetical protein
MKWISGEVSSMPVRTIVLFSSPAWAALLLPMKRRDPVPLIVVSMS